MKNFQRFFSGLAVFSALVIASALLTPDAQAIKVKINSGIGPIDLSVDTTASAGVTVRVAERDYDWVSPQNGGNDFVRRGAQVDSPTPQVGQLTRLSSTVGLGVGAPAIGMHPVTGAPIYAGEGRATNAVTYSETMGYKNGDDKNFAGGGNGDDGRLNFDQGDITALTLKSLFDIQADLPTEYGELTFFSRILMYYDPILRDGSFYERIGPDDAAKRELGRDLKVLDIYLSWDHGIPLGGFIGELPVNLRVGKLAANNWGESTFSLSGIAAGIVVDVPSARRAGAQIREIIQTEYMVYGSFGLPFDIGLSAYYQLHHTPWNLDVSGSPTATSDVGNPGNEIGGALLLSSNADTGTFRENCDGSPARQLAEDLGTPLPDLHPDCNFDRNDPSDRRALVHYETLFTDPRFGGVGGEVLRREFDDHLLAPVSFIDADDQGQFGVQLSYYVDDFYLIPPIPGMMENGFSLPGIEFTVSYQNVHSRLPYVRMKANGRPVLTKSIIGGSSTAGGIALTKLDCVGGAGAPDSLLHGLLSSPGAPAVAEAHRLAGNRQAAGRTITFGPGGFLANGDFNDPVIRQLQNTVDDRPGMRDPSSLGLDYDERHFGSNDRPGDQEANLLKYAAFADKVLNDPRIAANGLDLSAVGPLANIDYKINPDAHPDEGTPDSIVESIKSNGPNRFDVGRINCALAAVQTTNANLDLTDVASTFGTIYNPVIGSEFLSIQYTTRLELYYPEDIEIIGFGFNTTIPWLEWGLQGEVSYRPDMPLQIDTTEQIIAVAGSQCVSQDGDAGRFALTVLGTTSPDQTLSNRPDLRDMFYDDPIFANGGLTESCVPEVLALTIDGELDNPAISVFEADMLNLTIGTTALYNRSNPVVGFLGADQAVVLMEFNIITFLDDLPDGWGPTAAAGYVTVRENKSVTLACVARSGSEMPLAGVVGLDGLGDRECSPQETSFGYTILGFMDYNNVFGTAWRLRPQVAVRHGARGNTPSPIPGWREDTLSVNASVEAVFQNSWSARLGYTGFFDVGSNDYNSNSGFDTVSFNISYAF